MKFTIRNVGQVAEKYIGGKVRYKILKKGKVVHTLKTVSSVRTEPAGHGDVDTIVVTKNGEQLRFNSYGNGVLLANGKFLGENERFAFFPPKKPEAK